MKGYYAFWKYDNYPFVLGGPISRMLEHGSVETENYGPGFYFKPIKILPPKKGRALLAALEELEAKYRRARTAFEDKWAAAARTLYEKED